MTEARCAPACALCSRGARGVFDLPSTFARFASAATAHTVRERRQPRWGFDLTVVLLRCCHSEYGGNAIIFGARHLQGHAPCANGGWSGMSNPGVAGWHVARAMCAR